MAAITTWWSAQQLEPLVPVLGSHETRKGTFGGQCFHVTCRHSGADWFNQRNERYYCDSCARAINDDCAQQGVPASCELHL